MGFAQVKQKKIPYANYLHILNIFKNRLLTFKVIILKTKITIMEKFALLARLEAKSGKEKEVEEFIKSALPLAFEETDTLKWYGLKINENTFGIFDTFTTEDGRKAHLQGKIAAALMANAATLLDKDPVIEFVDLLAVK